MRTIQLQIPDDIELKDYDIKIRIATKLYQDRIISTGQGAKILGVSKRTFIELLGKYGVSLFGDNIDELHTEISNA